MTFRIGNVAVGSIDMNNIGDDMVFLQDLADVDRTDMNDEYLENMAVLLQSLDSDSGDNIVITEAMHEALSDDDFDLATVSEDELSAIIKANGAEAVSESDAMEHVGEMLEAYDGVEEGTLDQHVADGLEIITFTQEEVTFDFSNVENLGKIDLEDNSADVIKEISLDTLLDMSDESNNIVISGNEIDSVEAVDTTGWQPSSTTENGDGTTTFIYSNDTTSDSISITIDDNINNTGL